MTAKATKRAIAMTMRVASNTRAMAMATRVAGKLQQQEQWWWQQLWWAKMRVAATAMRVVGD